MTLAPTDVTIVVLAGGRATRLPRKLELRIGGESMLERVLRRLARSGYPLVLSVRARVPAALGVPLDVPQIEDAYPDAGPLGGLASAAARVRTALLFAAAADVPNLDERAVAALVALYETRSADTAHAPEAVIPRHPDGRIEPLASLYDTRALQAAAEEAIARGCLRVNAALASLRAAYYEIAPVEESRYHNVNTAEDFERINQR